MLYIKYSKNSSLVTFLLLKKELIMGKTIKVKIQTNEDELVEDNYNCDSPSHHSIGTHHSKSTVHGIKNNKTIFYQYIHNVYYNIFNFIMNQMNVIYLLNFLLKHQSCHPLIAIRIVYSILHNNLKKITITGQCFLPPTVYMNCMCNMVKMKRINTSKLWMIWKVLIRIDLWNLLLVL